MARPLASEKGLVRAVKRHVKWDGRDFGRLVNDTLTALAAASTWLFPRQRRGPGSTTAGSPDSSLRQGRAPLARPW
jgi:hypothetical protein